MPSDAMDQVSLHVKSPTERNTSFARDNFSKDVFPQRSGSTLKVSWSFVVKAHKSNSQFEEGDVVHEYGYGRNAEAVHHYRQNPHSAPPMSVTNARSPRKGNRSASTSVSSVYPPVVETPDEYADASTPPLDKRGKYLDAYDRPGPSNLSQNPPHSAPHHPGLPRAPSSGKLANMFHFSTSADPSKHQVRGGAHRGTKDYPHLKTKDLAVEELQERKALVGDSPTDVRESLEEEPMSAVTDESVGHVFQALVRPAPVSLERPLPNHERDGQITPRVPSAWKQEAREKRDMKMMRL